LCRQRDHLTKVDSFILAFLDILILAVTQLTLKGLLGWKMLCFQYPILGS